MADTEATSGQEPQASEDTASVQNGTITADKLTEGTLTVGKQVVVDDDPSTDELPEWARKQLKKANSEAASYRTQLREVQDQFKDAKTDAELEAILNPLNEKLTEYETRSRELERKLIIRDHGLTEDMAEFITGDTPEAWEAQAKKLSELAAANAPSQFDQQRQLRGRNGGAPNREFDAAEQARAHLRKHRD